MFTGTNHLGKMPLFMAKVLPTKHSTHMHTHTHTHTYTYSAAVLGKDTCPTNNTKSV